MASVPAPWHPGELWDLSPRERLTSRNLGSPEHGVIEMGNMSLAVGQRETEGGRSC